MTELAKIQSRLKKISGQVEGIDRMLENGRSCPDIIQQIVAVRSALASVGMEVTINESRICKSSGKKKSSQRLTKMAKNMFKLS